MTFSQKVSCAIVIFATAVLSVSSALPFSLLPVKHMHSAAASSEYRFLRPGVLNPEYRMNDEVPALPLDLSEIDPEGPTGKIVFGPDIPLPEPFPLEGDVWAEYFHVMILKLLRP